MRKLNKILKEAMNWEWSHFRERELSPTKNTDESVVISLLRMCADGDYKPIKLALNRIEGKIEKSVKMEFPKMYFIYPNATRTAAFPDQKQIDEESSKEPTKIDADDVEAIINKKTTENSKEALKDMTLKETLEKMSDAPYTVPTFILESKDQIDKLVEKGEFVGESPFVKSVVCANLIKLSQEHNLSAIEEIFNQIDGKLEEVVKVLGDDVYIAKYDEVAPQGSYKNKDGVYISPAKKISQTWEERLR